MFHVKRCPMNKRIALVGAAVLVSLTAAACGAGYDQQHNHNTGIGGYVSPPNQIIEFPYGFDNIARVCSVGDGLYVGFGGNSTFVVAHDPACPQ
jgi:hypothetical protein